MSSTDGRHYALGVLFVIGLTNYVDRISLGILQIPIKTELGLSDAELGALTGLAFSIPYALLGWPIARWADRGNRIHVLGTVLALWSAATAGVSLARGFLSLVILRMGVAIGEAACLPTSYSLLADYFPRDRRGRAIAIFALAFPLGSMLGLAGGGTLGALIGWRGAFLAIGLFGLALVPIVLVTLREPARGAMDEAALGAQAVMPSVSATIRMLWNLKVFRNLALATSLQAYVTYTIVNWSAPFYVRVHHLSLSKVALILGVLMGVGGASGSYLGGLLGDRLAASNRRWYIWIPALACGLLVPFGLAQFAAVDMSVSLAFGAISATLGSIFLAPVYAVTQSLVAPNVRAFTTATLVALTALIGGAFGPFLTGALSDLFGHLYGTGQALRYAICSSLVFSALAAGLYLRAASQMARE